ncbi:MAG: ABC transporter permease [Dehalococcoidia bacterium]|nr:ABC transporter permease [Dehalococcoidia bacterium]
MSIWQSMRIAGRALRVNALRSLLTMLGVIIGVAAVITTISIGNGASEQVTRRFKAMGTNLLVINPGKTVTGGVVSAADRVVSLTREDAEALKDLPAVAAVAPEVGKSIQVTYGNRNTVSNITGTTPEFASARNYNIDRGRFVTDADVISGRCVAVLGQDAVNILFGNADPLGRAIRINKVEYEVVGILQTKGIGGNENRDDLIIVPITTAQKRLMGPSGSNLRTINVAAISADRIGDAEDQVRTLLRVRHRLDASKPDDFELKSQSDLVEASESASATFTVLLTGIAAVSLFVGGIGIMNIMLVSVTERTREIGIRMAFGAQRRIVMRQFVIEAVVLGMIGGVIGVMVGALASWGVSRWAGWVTLLSPEAIAMAFAFAVVVGLFFGIYPARKASRLNPIDALRYE